MTTFTAGPLEFNESVSLFNFGQIATILTDTFYRMPDVQSIICEHAELIGTFKPGRHSRGITADEVRKTFGFR